MLWCCRMSDEALGEAAAVMEHFMLANPDSPVHGIGVVLSTLLDECHRARRSEKKMLNILQEVDAHFQTEQDPIALCTHHSISCRYSMEECTCHVAKIRALLDHTCEATLDLSEQETTVKPNDVCACGHGDDQQ